MDLMDNIKERIIYLTKEIKRHMTYIIGIACQKLAIMIMIPF